MRRIYLIDCPGIFPVSAKDSQTDTVLKGVVRVENLPTPSEHIPTLLSRVPPPRHLPPNEDEQGKKHEPKWDADAFLDAPARKSGKWFKGGELDRETVAKMELNDWMRGKIPFFVRPSEDPEEPEGKKERTGEKGCVPGVDQKVGAIVVWNSFEGDNADARRPGKDEKLVDEDERADVDEESGDDQSSAEEDDERVEESEEEDEESDGELAWEDVFPAAASGAVADSDEESESEASESDGAAPSTKKRWKAPFRGLPDEGGPDTPVKKKEPGMTTKQEKGHELLYHRQPQNRNRDCKTPGAPGTKGSLTSLQLRAARGGRGVKRR